ncbi:hypothetical protein PG994_005745 [Apiospora phragmitis]|uniref:Coatomer subunit epsilon n=1 Tax=Apiospora phragmitis TaxID=2905665 RepID=A0ABR1VD30_9PEZI
MLRPNSYGGWSSCLHGPHAKNIRSTAPVCHLAALLIQYLTLRPVPGSRRFRHLGPVPRKRPPCRVLALRARIALGQADDVIAEVQGESEPELVAVGALVQHSLGKTDAAVETIEGLASSSGDNATVQTVGGTVLQAAGKSEEALALLSQHSGNLEAVALITQIHLLQNRSDLALKEVKAARSWAQDSLLVNLAESWVGVRMGGDRYQQAFYVFEELAQAPSTSSIVTLVSQSAVQKDPKYAEAIANLLVLNIVTGKNPSELTASLQSVDPTHPFLTDLAEKDALFDKAASKFSAKVSA